MNKILLKPATITLARTLVLMVLIMYSGGRIAGQCTYTPNTVSPPFEAFIPTCPSETDEFISEEQLGSYSRVHVTAGNEYVFSAGYYLYLTLYTPGGQIIAWGYGPLTYHATFTGELRFASHLNDACLFNDQVYYSRSVRCLGNPCMRDKPLEACGVPQTVTLSGTGQWASCSQTAGREQVFTYTPEVTAAHALEVLPGSTGTISYSWKLASGGCSSGGWNCLGATSGADTIPLPLWTAGVPVLILLDAGTADPVSHTFQINCPPENDHCANAIDLNAENYDYPSIYTGLATNTGPVTSCAGPYKNIWFTISGICGPMIASTCYVSDFDTKVTVFQGTCNDLVEVACNDNNGPTCAGTQASAGWDAYPEITYYISVGSASPSGSGTTALIVEHAPGGALTTATVGTGQGICAGGTTNTLGGNFPLNGSGLWSVVSGGTGTFSQDYSPHATFTHTGGGGPVILRWTITNGWCSSYADLSITIYPQNTATTGPDQSICVGGTSAGLGANVYEQGLGLWSVVSGGTGSFSPNANSPNATFTHTGGAGPIVLRWTLSSLACATTTADMTITLLTSDTDGDGITDCEDSCPFLYGIIGSPCNAGFGPATGTISPNCMCVANVQDYVRVNVRIFLDGTYNTGTGLMNDLLRTNGLIPFAQPYADAPFGHAGTESLFAAILGDAGDNAIVDWVILELRDPAEMTMVIARRAALLKRNGWIVDTNGSNPVRFDDVPAGNYKLAVRHRNHMGVATGDAYALDVNSPFIDLTLEATAVHGTTSRKTFGSGAMGLWTGNTNSNTVLNYIGLNNDRQVILNVVGATTPNLNLTSVYNRADVNLNGTVNYIGLNNDRQLLLNNVGATTPNQTRTQSLP